MSGFETRIDDAGKSSFDRLVNLALTLVVATVITVACALVLSPALLGRTSNGPAHRRLAATLHAHTRLAAVASELGVGTPFASEFTSHSLGPWRSP